jgi:hypothetical protein
MLHLVCQIEPKSSERSRLPLLPKNRLKKQKPGFSKKNPVSFFAVQTKFGYITIGCAIANKPSMD